MRGLHAVCLDCEVVKKDKFTGSSGPVFQLQVQGQGLNHTFRTDKADEAELWPAVNSVCDIECRLEPTKDGSYRLGVAAFHDAANRVLQNGAAGTKQQPEKKPA